MALSAALRPRLFQRDWRIIVGTESAVGVGRAKALDVTNLDCEFKIAKSLRPEPNTCDLKVYNLTPDQVAKIQALNIYEPIKVKGATKSGPRNRDSERSRVAGQTRAPKPGRIRTEIMAGYKDTGTAIIFRGDLRTAMTRVEDDRTRVTSIRGEDGGSTVVQSRICRGFPAGSTYYQVVVELCDALGIGPGNLLEVRDQLSEAFPFGTTVDGPAFKELKLILRRARLRVSIQDGNLFFLPVGEGRGQARAVLLSESTGLVGTPEVNVNGRVVARCLLNPFIALGGYVKLINTENGRQSETALYSGGYMVDSIKYDGHTRSNAWYSDLELLPVAGKL